MNDKYLESLEIGRILKSVASWATHPLSIKKILNLSGAKNYNEMEDRIYRTKSALDFIRKYQEMPLGSLVKMESTLEKIKVGSQMSIKDLTLILKVMEESNSIINYALVNLKDDFYNPLFKRLIAILKVDRNLFTELKKLIDENGEIDENYSSELKEIRIKIIGFEKSIRNELNVLMRSNKIKEALQDTTYTKRGDSYCLLLKREFLSRVDGIVIDYSSSGQTVYIEPKKIFDIRSKISILKFKRAEIIEEILIKFSSIISYIKDEIITNYETLGEYNYYIALALFVNSIDGVIPKINDQEIIKIVDGKHPLLKEPVVANSVEVGLDKKIVIITGPNTGGKTVLLKMIGLFSEMVKMGLGIPAKEGTNICFFSEIFVLIGDQQNLDYSLSTFSAHIVNLNEILNNATSSSLILIDELGSGTDPKEGVALAKAILIYLRDIGAQVFVTTHFSELKVFASKNDQFVNGAVDFNHKEFTPTYKFSIGVPGSSLGLKVAEIYNMKNEVIKRAEKYMESRDLDVSKLLLELDEKRIELRKQEIEIYGKIEENKELNNTLIKLKDELFQEKESIKKRYKEKYDNFLTEEKITLEREISQLKKSYKEDKSSANIIRNRLNKINIKGLELKSKIENIKPDSKYVKGLKVYVKRYNKEGIIEKVDFNKNLITVKIGIMTVKVKADEIKIVNNNSFFENEKNTKIKFRNENIPLEINLCGMNIADSIFILDSYLDSAYLNNYPSVKVIHGKGTGALRNGLRQYFLKHPLVKDFKYGDSFEGGDGVTIIIFKI